jgi:hypothetical protein
METIFSWQQAEELAAAHMRSLGFLDATRTRDGADGGLDVVAENAVAQVKHHQAKTGAPDVQRLRGAGHKFSNLLFYSSAGYTPAAVAAADELGVALFTYTTANQVSAINGNAERLNAREASADMVVAAVNESMRVVLRAKAWNDAFQPHIDDARREIADIEAEAARLGAIEGSGGRVPAEDTSRLMGRFEALTKERDFLEDYRATYQQPFREKIEALNAAVEYTRDRPGPGLRHLQRLLTEFDDSLHALRDDMEARRPALAMQAHGALTRLLESDYESAVSLREDGLTVEL